MAAPLTAADVAQIVAQAFATAGIGQQVQGPAPAPAQNPTGPSMVSRPRKYDGGKDYEHFRRECQIFINQNANSFATDRNKIAFVLSYLKSEKAAAWAQNYIDQHTRNNTITFPNDYDAFLTELDASFGDPMKKQKALERFYQSKQGNRSAEEFFVELDQLIIAAGLTDAKHDEVIIEQLKKAVHEDVYRGVARADPAPTTYAAWKKKAKEVDVVEETIRRNRAERTRFQPRAPPRLSIPQAPFRPPQAPPPVRPQAFAPRDHQGVKPGTHPGRGIPMDVDINALRQQGKCYKCRQPGHFANNCPLNGDTKGIFQRFFYALTPEDRLALGEVVGSMPESAFRVQEEPEIVEEEIVEDFIEGQE